MPYQVRNILFRPESADAPRNPTPGAQGSGRVSLTPKQTFWHVHRKLHALTEEETQQKWDAFLEANPKLKQTDRNRELLARVDAGELTLKEAFPDPATVPSRLHKR